jgi:hypothetical protein
VRSGGRNDRAGAIWWADHTAGGYAACILRFAVTLTYDPPAAPDHGATPLTVVAPNAIAALHQCIRPDRDSTRHLVGIEVAPVKLDDSAPS